LTFKNHVEEVLKEEINNTIRQQGYILETEFCKKVCEKYSFAIYTVRPVLRRIYPEMSLMKRRMSDELKAFYRLEVKGCPIVYMPTT